MKISLKKIFLKEKALETGPGMWLNSPALAIVAEALGPVLSKGLITAGSTIPVRLTPIMTNSNFHVAQVSMICTRKCAIPE